jgi:methionine-rich copper-binding protein CopC
MRFATRLATTTLLAAAAILLGGTPAQAHNILTSAYPARGSTINESPKYVVVTFDKPVQDGFTELTVAGPDNTHWRTGAPTINGNTVSATLDPLGPAGLYTIEYRIVSADGHPVSGNSTFTLAVAGPGKPATAQLQSGTAATASGSASGSGTPIWLWIVGAGGVLLLALLTARRLATRP